MNKIDYNAQVPMWVAHNSAEVVEWMRHHTATSENYRMFVDQVLTPVLDSRPYIEVFYETPGVPGFIPDKPAHELYMDLGGGYFSGTVGKINGKPAIVGGFGDSNHSAPSSVIMSLQHWADLPPTPE